MTVKQILEVIPHSTEVSIAFNGNAMKINKDDPFIQDAFGSYVIEKIYPFDNEIEIDIKMQPVRKDD